MAQGKEISDINTDERIVWGNVVFLLLTPLMALILAPWFALNYTVTMSHIIAVVVLWWATGLGITVGYHRLFSHRTYKAPTWYRLIFAILGAAAWQNSIIAW